MDHFNLSEEDWFATDWSADDLKQQYNDDSLSEQRREHAFYRFWDPHLRNTEGLLTEDQVGELIKYSRWSIMIGGLAGRMAIARRLNNAATFKLLFALPKGSWGSEQMMASLIIRDDSIPYLQKLELFLLLKAYWAVKIILRSYPDVEKYKIIEILDSAPLPKKVRAAFDKVMNNSS